MLIGINGAKGAGKDTAGAYLVEKYFYERLSFAQKLKESAAALFDVDPACWEEWKNDKAMRVMLYRAADNVLEPLLSDNINDDSFIVTIKVREFLQRYGTESHREIFGQDFWVDQALKGVDTTGNYLFTDARFPNELSKIKFFDGINIRIVRDSASNSDNHASEAEPPPHLIDYVVPNNGDYYDLYNHLDTVMDEIKYWDTDYELAYEA